MATSANISTQNTSVFLRLWAILRTDAVLRLRRTSTLVLMLLVGVMAYTTIPDPATGRGLFVINGARTLYNAASLSFATGLMWSLIGVGLFGFYMVSNTIRRDVDSRVGNVLAATPMHSWEYIAGKFLGNVAFLSILTIFYMAAMMLMYTLRGEAPFELFVFMRTYSVMCISSIVFVSVVALVFESLPVLSGRVGDVVYFFIWVVIIALPVVQLDQAFAEHKMRTGSTDLTLTFSEIPLAAYYDVFGMGTGMASLNAQMPAANNGFSIGQTPFDQHLASIVLQEIRIPDVWLVVKSISLVLMMSFLTIAYIAFHRFDPTRVRASVRHSKRNIFAALNAALKPVSKINTVLRDIVLGVFGKSIFLTAVSEEIFLLLAVKPLGMVGLVGFNAVALFLPLSSVQTGLLPVACVVLVALCSDNALRERQRGTTGLIFSLPIMKSHFIWIKLASTLVFALLLVIVPLVRIMFDSPGTASSLAVGMFFLASASVGLGTVSGTAKTFLVCSLVLFYMCLNSNGLIPIFHFGGWYGAAETSIQAGYAATAVALLVIAHAVQWWRVER